jgi:UDP-N-acetylmuramate--alanine ligase
MVRIISDKSSCLFQPHLFSRTKDFADDFAKSLSQFDELLFRYLPARELPMEGITSEWLLGKVDHKNKKLISKEDVISGLRK